MAIRACNGRWGRYYLVTPAQVDVDPLAVTYHKPVGGKLRQLTVSPRLLRKVLRQSPSEAQERASEAPVETSRTPR